MHARAALASFALLLSTAFPFAIEPARAQEAAQSEAPASPLPGPGKAQPIAGLHGFESESRLTFHEPADAVPQRLECCEVFPARARWCLRPFDDPPGEATPGQRFLQYRYGEQAYVLPVSAAKSVEVLGLDRIEQLLAMELRHALFLYPDGLEWKQEGRIARVDLGALGLLVATLDEKGRPTSVSSLCATGEIRDSYKELVWQTIDGRAWPASASLYHANGKVWDEQVLAVRTSKRFVDSFFLPPDLRERAGSGGGELADTQLVQAIRMRPAVRKRFALELSPGWTWEDVFARSAERARETAAALGADKPGLESAYYYELGKEGAPVALYLHLEGHAPTEDKVPEGWEALPAREAFSLVLPGVDRLGAVALGRLAKAAEAKGARTASPVLRVPSAEPAKALAQLLLPLQD
jgi:hypothetical protein